MATSTAFLDNYVFGADEEEDIVVPSKKTEEEKDTAFTTEETKTTETKETKETPSAFLDKYVTEETPAAKEEVKSDLLKAIETQPTQEVKAEKGSPVSGAQSLLGGLLGSLQQGAQQKQEEILQELKETAQEAPAKTEAYKSLEEQTKKYFGQSLQDISATTAPTETTAPTDAPQPGTQTTKFLDQYIGDISKSIQGGAQAGLSNLLGKPVVTSASTPTIYDTFKQNIGNAQNQAIASAQQAGNSQLSNLDKYSTSVFNTSGSNEYVVSSQDAAFTPSPTAPLPPPNIPVLAKKAQDFLEQQTGVTAAKQQISTEINTVEKEIKDYTKQVASVALTDAKESDDISKALSKTIETLPESSQGSALQNVFETMSQPLFSFLDELRNIYENVYSPDIKFPLSALGGSDFFDPKGRMWSKKGQIGYRNYGKRTYQVGIISDDFGYEYQQPSQYFGYLQGVSPVAAPGTLSVGFRPSASAVTPSSSVYPTSAGGTVTDATVDLSAASNNMQLNPSALSQETMAARSDTEGSSGSFAGLGQTLAGLNDPIEWLLDYITGNKNLKTEQDFSSYTKEQLVEVLNSPEVKKRIGLLEGAAPGSAVSVDWPQTALSKDFKGKLVQNILGTTVVVYINPNDGKLKITDTKGAKGEKVITGNTDLNPVGKWTGVLGTYQFDRLPDGKFDPGDIQQFPVLKALMELIGVNRDDRAGGYPINIDIDSLKEAVDLLPGDSLMDKIKDFIDASRHSIEDIFKKLAEAKDAGILGASDVLSNFLDQLNLPNPFKDNPDLSGKEWVLRGMWSRFPDYKSTEEVNEMVDWLYGSADVGSALKAVQRYPWWQPSFERMFGTGPDYKRPGYSFSLPVPHLFSQESERAKIMGGGVLTSGPVWFHSYLSRNPALLGIQSTTQEQWDAEKILKGVQTKTSDLFQQALNSLKNTTKDIDWGKLMNDISTTVGRTGLGS